MMEKQVGKFKNKVMVGMDGFSLVVVVVSTHTHTYGRLSGADLPSRRLFHFNTVFSFSCHENGCRV